MTPWHRSSRAFYYIWKRRTAWTMQRGRMSPNMSLAQKNSRNVVWKMRNECFWACDQDRLKAPICLMPSGNSPRTSRAIAEYNVRFAGADEHTNSRKTLRMSCIVSRRKPFVTCGNIRALVRSPYCLCTGPAVSYWRLRIMGKDFFYKRPMASHTDLVCVRCLTEPCGSEGGWTSTVVQEQARN